MANVLITGCSSGFGFETALAFARHGDHVFATMRDTAKGAELEQLARCDELPLEVLRLDVCAQFLIDA